MGELAHRVEINQVTFPTICYLNQIEFSSICLSCLVYFIQMQPSCHSAFSRHLFLYVLFFCLKIEFSLHQFYLLIIKLA